MNILKDLLYNKDNQNLDISRVSALLSVIGYLVISPLAMYLELWKFDALEWGTGWAAVASGNAAWIFARQRYEAGIASSTEKS